MPTREVRVRVEVALRGVLLAYFFGEIRGVRVWRFLAAESAFKPLRRLLTIGQCYHKRLGSQGRPVAVTGHKLNSTGGALPAGTPQLGPLATYRRPWETATHQILGRMELQRSA